MVEPAHLSSRSADAAPAIRWLEAHGDALYAYALARVRAVEAAEDLVQETLLAALAARHKFAGLAAERTWLTGILKHKLVDHLRKAVRQRPLTEVRPDGMLDVFDQHGRWRVAPSSWRADPQSALENAEFREVLARCLGKLPARMAQLFWLREAEGIGSGPLCQELQISPTNLWTMLHRARLRLRRCLSENWFDREIK